MRKVAFGAVVVACLAVSGVAGAQDLQPPGAVPPGYPGGAQPAPQGTPAETSAEADLEKSKKEDSGLGLEWIWANADIGASYIDMKSFSESQLAVVDSSKAGAVFGVGAGIRLFFLTLGLRARNHTGLNLWQINAEVGFHMRVWRIDPYLAFRGGYDTVGTLSQSVDVATSSSQPADVKVHGWNVGAALGMDVYLAKWISLGGELAGDVLFLQRPASPLPPLTPQQQMAINSNPQAAANYAQAQQLYAQSGSSVGFGGALTAHLGIHF